MNTIFKNDYLKFSEVPELNAIVCQPIFEYIPIESFQTGFNHIKKASKEAGWNALIFDKSKLSTFHQPTMEWYYTDWKKAVAENGLTQHYKILPPHDWFKKSVEAGKSEIHQKHPDLDLSHVSINYVNSMEEGLAEIKRLQKRA